MKLNKAIVTVRGPLVTWFCRISVIAIIFLLLAGSRVEAETYTASWLDLTSSVPGGGSVQSGQTFNLPGYSGTVTFSYTSTSLNWLNVAQFGPMQNGQVTSGNDVCGWGTINGYLGAVNGGLGDGPVDYNLTFTFNGSPIPAGQLVLGSLGLGGLASPNEGWSVVTVTNNADFLGDWLLVDPSETYAPTAFNSGFLPGGAAYFTLSNSVTEPASGYFNTDFGVTRIDDNNVTSITLAVHHIGGDGFGFTVGLLSPTPCAGGCLTIYTPANIVVSTCSNSVPVSYDVNVTDSCDPGGATLNLNPPSGFDFPIGTTVVTCTAADPFEESECTFNVTVLSNAAPVFTAGPAAVSVCNNAAGSIIVNSDEWPFSDQGFTNEGLANGEVFAVNCAAFLTAGTGRNILIYSDNHGLTGTLLSKTLQAAGYNVTLDTTLSPPLTLSLMSSYSAVFLGGDPLTSASIADLGTYICDGGGVYIAAGTGNTGSIPGGAPGEAAQWNSLINAYGLNLASQYNSLNGSISIGSNPNPALVNVTQMFFDDGQDVSVLPGNPAARIIAAQGSDGLIGVSSCSVGCGQMPDVTSQMTVTGAIGPVTQSIPAGSIVCASTSVTLTATNACGNTTTTSIPVNLVPCSSCAPQVYCPADTVLSIPCSNSIIVTNYGSGAIMLQSAANSSILAILKPSVFPADATVSVTPGYDVLLPGTTNTFTCTAYGCDGQTSSCNFTVTVLCQAPTITNWPSAVTNWVDCTEGPGCVSMPDETTNSAWGGNPVFQSIPVGTPLCCTVTNVFVTNVVFTFTNCCQRVSTYTGTIYVEPIARITATTNGDSPFKPFMLGWLTPAELTNVLPAPWGLQHSTNLRMWQPVTNVSNYYDATNLILHSTYTVTNLLSSPMDFFRLVTPFFKTN